MQFRFSDRQQNFAITSLILLAGVLAFSVSQPGAQEWLKDHFLSHRRIILSKIEGDITGKGDFMTVLKVKTDDSLAIEVHSRGANETLEIKRLVLNERRDGHMTLQGQMTNLALLDIDGDGKLEILAPSFDENLVPRLNVFRYDEDSHSFRRSDSSDKALNF